MTFLGLLLRNLRYHWRGNLAVFLGVALGTSVLTGALFVGDSLRGSLKALTLDQLGWVEQALTPGRFFRAALAEALPATRAAPAILLQSSAKKAEGAKGTTGKVTLLGIDDRFWPAEMKQDAALWQSADDAVVLNYTLAAELQAQVGDRLQFNVQKNDAASRETLLGKRDEVVQSINVTVKAILPEAGMARFTLRPSPQPVRNAFVPLKFLQDKLELPGKANAILVGASSDDLAKKLAQSLTLDDWNLKLRRPADRARDLVRFLEPNNKDGVLRKKNWVGRVPEELAELADPKGNLALTSIVGYYEKSRPRAILESGQMFLDAATEKAAVAALIEPPPFTPLLYLADSITDGHTEMPYSVIAAVPPGILSQIAPDSRAGIASRVLKNDEIAICTWPGMPLEANVGDPITVSYYVPDERNALQKKSETFRLAFYMPLAGALDDPDWTPQFPGITDKLSISEWQNPPFPYDYKRIKANPANEEYWKRYRAAPKAYVTLATGQRLWASRFGKITSVWVAGDAAEFERKLLQALSPDSGGFIFQNVREQAERSSRGTVDFGEFFFYFSFFLIVSALLLVGLLFRLNMDRRAAEMGLLLATGWSHGQVRRLLLAEGGILAVIGALVGFAGALAYGQAMLDFLAASWPGGTRLAFLRLHTSPLSFGIGYTGSVAVSLLTILWATRVLGKLAPRSLLAGETTAASASYDTGDRQGRWSGVILIGAMLGAAGALALGLGLFDQVVRPIGISQELAKVIGFFLAGALLLTAALALSWRLLKSGGARHDPQPSLTRLGTRNAGRNPVRSVLTVGLLASATFLIVAVEAFHKDTGHEFFTPHGGSGGFTLLAETDVPYFKDLNDLATQKRWDVFVKKDEESLAAQKLLQSARYIGLRVRQGDDTSCLNLYQPLKPRVVGMPAKLCAEPRFTFGARLNPTDAETANPWLLLERKADDGVIPAIVDANTAQWILKVALGDTLNIADDNGDKVKLRIVGLLKESIFQGEILVAEENFLRLFPRQEGFQMFLVETPLEQADETAKALREALTDQGVLVMSTSARLQSYLDVENMYLDTFKLLGGLGLLLGAAGLAIVLLRGVWERRGELALLRALGFRGEQLAWLVLAENALLLAMGLAAGSVAAMVAVAPHLAGSGAAPLWGRLALLLTGVVAVGLASGAAAVWGSLRTPVLTALRRE